MANISYTSNGYTVHEPEEEDKWENRYPDSPRSDYEGFNGRRPILMSGRNIYLGHPNDYHDDAAEHHNIGWDEQRDMAKGYFHGGLNWGDKKLTWYNYPVHVDPETHNDVHAALTERGYQIPPSPPPVDPYANLRDEDDHGWDDDESHSDESGDWTD